MQNALNFLFRTLTDLYIITFVLRFVLNWIRADARNPLAQFILRVTNPLVIPVRRFIPSVAGLDTATILLVVVLEITATVVLLNLACVTMPDPSRVVAVSLIRLVHLILNLYFFLILAYVILSWVSTGGYNPAAALLSRVVEPLLAPFRKWIPSIGGLDLSPLIAIIAIQFFVLLLPSAQSLMPGALCSAVGGLI